MGGGADSKGKFKIDYTLQYKINNIKGTFYNKKVFGKTTDCYMEMLATYCTVQCTQTLYLSHDFVVVTFYPHCL